MPAFAVDETVASAAHHDEPRVCRLDDVAQDGAQDIGLEMHLIRRLCRGNLRQFAHDAVFLRALLARLFQCRNIRRHAAQPREPLHAAALRLRRLLDRRIRRRLRRYERGHIGSGKPRGGSLRLFQQL